MIGIIIGFRRGGEMKKLIITILLLASTAAHGTPDLVDNEQWRPGIETGVNNIASSRTETKPVGNFSPSHGMSSSASVPKPYILLLVAIGFPFKGIARRNFKEDYDL